MPDSTFSWNERAGRFRDASGRFVPEAKVRSGVDAVVDAASQRASNLAKDLREGRINLEQFRDGMFQAIKDVHIASALSAYGGKQAMNESKWGFVGSQIKAQYMYARGMLNDIISGKQAMNGRLDQRAIMYMEAARTTYETIRLREGLKRGVTQVRNILHAKESCDQCKGLTGDGWMDADKMIPIGARQCLSRCACTLEMRILRAAA